MPMTTGARHKVARPEAAASERCAPKTVLFGVGSPKCGTSWLHGYLQRHPDCAMRQFKELNYFNTVETGGYDRRIALLQRKLQIIVADLARPGIPAERRAGMAQQQADIHEAIALLDRRADDPAAYMRYLAGGWQGEALVADLTPTYAMLPPKALQRMLTTAPDTRVLFLMRDPVERLWSHVRMYAQLSLPPGESLELHTARWLDMALARREPGRPAMLDYSDYAGIVARLRAVVPGDRLCLMFTEDLLDETGTATLCAFLGIRSVAPDLDRRANRGVPVRQPEAARAAMRRVLRPQYEFAARSFPALPTVWTRTMSEGFA